MAIRINAAKVLRWRLARPLQTLRERRSRRETTHVLVVLRPEAARAVYWSFYEGVQGNLFP